MQLIKYKKEINMSNCKECGADNNRSNQLYCSNKCKQKAYRKRMNGSNGLSDVAPPKFVYRPRNANAGSNMAIQRSVTNNLVGAYSNNLGGGLSDGIKTITNVNNHPAHSLSMLFGGVLGGYVGWNMSGKNKKLSGVIMGSGLGFLTGQIAYSLYTQINEYFEQKNNHNQQYGLESNLSEEHNSNSIYSSQDLQYMQVNTIKTPNMFVDFLGTDLNYGFTTLLYGGAGSGKSHLSTLFANKFETMGRCLYVLAEEGITNSVQKRIEKYNLKNTDFVTTRSEAEVLKLAPNYKFIFIDSINGMVNYNNHLEFVRKLKSNKNLYGVFIVNQVNKDGQFTGKNEVLHEVDVEITVENGVAETKKNRFNYGGKQFNIFDNKTENVLSFQPNKKVANYDNY